jgi:hypothetical protein
MKTQPTGFNLVTRDEFYKLLYADKRDIMPTVKDPESTTWETRDGYVWGWSWPGWSNVGEGPPLWAVRG